jgi:HAMP domain-containing protein
MRRAFTLLPIPLIYAVGALTYIKVTRADPELARVLLWVGFVPLGVLIGATVHALFRARPAHVGALALDRHHGLSDRITTALSFAAVPEERRTALMRLAIEDAVHIARELAPRRAAPLHVPRELPIVALLVLGVIGIALLEVRIVRELPPERRIEPLTLSGDDIELFREMADELEKKGEDPEARAAVRRFNQLVEDIAERRLDRREVFQRLEQLERQLAKSAEADREALQEALKSVARELEKADLSKPVAEPLAEKRLEDAEKALRELAEKLKNRKDPPSKQELEKLRSALDKASTITKEQLKSIEQRRQELAESEARKRLLKKKDEGKLDAKEQKQLSKMDRQLEKLDRQVDRGKRAQRQMSKLDRELAEAAKNLMEEMGASAEDLQQGAQDLNRMAREELGEKEKQELLRRLREMREVIRQQGKGGQKRMQRMQGFSRRARGQSGEQGEGKQGQGRQLVFGPDGKPIPMPGQGQGQGRGGMGEMPGSGQPGAQGQGEQPGGGTGEGGQQWGTGHSDNLKGEQTSLKGQTKDVSAAGADTGEGSASSEVIYGAAQRGFTGRGYKNVYTQYREVAEEVIEKDDIPPGYRFYVQRYFQLIRPRE